MRLCPPDGGGILHSKFQVLEALKVVGEIDRGGELHVAGILYLFSPSHLRQSQRYLLKREEIRPYLFVCIPFKGVIDDHHWKESYEAEILKVDKMAYSDPILMSNPVLQDRCSSD